MHTLYFIFLKSKNHEIWTAPPFRNRIAREGCPHKLITQIYISNSNKGILSTVYSKLLTNIRHKQITRTINRTGGTIRLKNHNPHN